MRRQLQALTITLIVFCTISAQLDPKYSFSEFMSTYSKVYEGQEKSARESEFNINYAELLRLRKLGYDAKPNQFMDWHSNQIDDFFNYKPLNSGLQFTERFDSSAPSTDSPSEFDWRTHRAVSPIKDQGKFGSSLIFASTAQFESLLAIASKGIVYDLSEQYVRECQSGPSQNGLRIPSIQVLHESGVSLEFDHPYDPSTTHGGICSDDSDKVRLSQIVKDATFPNFHDLTAQQLQQDLVTYGPITVGVSGSDSSFKYAGPSGLISCSASSEVDHAVLLVGYNSTHWFVKNSWGTTWGDKGFGYISKQEQNDCRIRSYVNEIRLGSTPVLHLSSSRLLTQSSTLTLSITMTDLGENGWQGYVLGIRQNGVLAGTFGENFYSGGSSGPVTIDVEGDKLAQVFVSQYGQNQFDIGFDITAPNGTIIFSRKFGNSFASGLVLASFCPISNCPESKYATFSIMLYSEGEYGWQGNILFIKQNGKTIERLGSNYLDGSSGGPYHITVKGNLETVFMYYIEYSVPKVGITINYINGTQIYRREVTEDSPNSLEVLFAFCPLGGCELNFYMPLSITMTDSGGNGWSNNVLSIIQNKAVTKTFGNKFLSGNSAAGKFAILANTDTSIGVSSLGTNSEQIGFVIRALNGEKIYERLPGTPFKIGTIFTRFCSGQKCGNSNLITLAITMTDSGSDGWNGNIFAFKQNGVVIDYFGYTFTSGSTSGPIYITMQGNLQTKTQIVVQQLGTKTEEVGFTIKAPNGTVVYQRTSGATFSDGEVLSSFCPIRCPTYMTLSITTSVPMYYAHWGGFALGLYQNGIITNIVQYSSTPQSIKVQSQIQTVISNTARFINYHTNTVGLTVRAPNGTTIYQRPTGSYFEQGFILTSFCPAGGCGPTNFLTLTITMTDSGNNGWDGTTFAVKQKNKVVSYFGSDFTSGGSSGPLYITVQGDLETTITAGTIGGNTNEIGFQVKSSNGTLIYKRNSGKTLKIGNLMAAFCPIDNCMDNIYQSLVINMTDSGNDGWNSNVLAIRQNGTLITTFGDGFTSGSSTTANIYAVVKSYSTFEVVVSQLGTKSEEVGFTIRSINGDTIYKRASGQKFYAGTVFESICTLEPCKKRSFIKLAITMTDSGSDGWNGNIFAFKQNNVIVATFGSTFASGSSSGPIPIYVTMQGNLQTKTQIVVQQLGTKTEEVGFTIKAPNGTVVYKRTSGVTFSDGEVLSSFCPIRCPTYMTLTVAMVDTSANGWGGTSLALSQDNFFRNLGSDFQSGASSTVQAAFDDSRQIKLSVNQAGLQNSYEIGFRVTAPNGTEIINVIPGDYLADDYIYSEFCLNSCQTFINVTITLTDTYGDGWNGNVLAIKQNTVIVGTFGREFRTGVDGGQVSIELQPNAQAKIVVLKMGTKSEQIGFVMKAPNGTIIHQRESGVAFTPTTSFSSFCPVDDCPPTNEITLSLTMTGTNGWNSNILAFKQDNQILETFGSSFTSGNSAGPISITVQKDKEVQVIVSQLGTNTEQIGFTITSSSGTVLQQRTPGSPFYAASTLSAFCPVADGCEPSNYLKLAIAMTDSGSDGWNGNIMAIKQAGQILGTFGNGFTSGKNGLGAEVLVDVYKGTQIVVQTLGTKTNEVGFTVKKPNGDTLYQRTSGTTFAANNLFTTFCPGDSCFDLTTLSITMTDTAGDGWNYNIIGVKQNGILMGTFGPTFKTGASSDPIYIGVLATQRVQIAVLQLGLRTNEIGFVVKDQTGKTIFTRNSGTTFTYTTVFTYFCPGTCSSTLTLTITMTDSGNDGWNSNVLAVQQQGNLVGTFGGSFTSGGSSGPISMVLQGNKETVILVYQFGTKTEEIGFTVTASNGTVIYQRASGVPFFQVTGLSLFCPIDGCPSSYYFKLTITMTDTGNDGWNNNILAVKQSGTVVDTFGGAFKSGNSTAPVTIILQGNLGAQIVVYQLGTKTEEMAFIARAPNNAIISQKNSGTTFAANNVFATFCPIDSCVDIFMLEVTMTDTGNDGWNYNIIGIKQNGALVGTFGSAFKTGGSSGPLYIPVLPDERIQIVVSQLGLRTNEIGFVVKDPSGTVLYTRSSGTTFTAATIFSYFCPASCSSTLDLTITMTDSGNDGWDSNVMAIKQNNAVVGTFGGDFTSGGSSGPVTITVEGDKEVQIGVSQAGTKREEVGFVVTAPNGTVIYEKISGGTFLPSLIFFNFCPFGGCPSSNFLTLSITMTDTGNDGWNGNVFGVKQGNVVMGTFGETFKSGSTGTTAYITLQGDMEARVVFTQFGPKVNEIGFVVKTPNGTIVARKYTGTVYLANRIFSTFCPIDNCPSNPNADYSLTLTDSGSNGWQGTILAFKQNGATLSTFTMSSGASSGPTTVTLPKYIATSIAVSTLGANSHQVGFKIVNSYGETVIQRNPGARLYVSTPVATFCTECVNLASVPTVVGNSELRTVEESNYYEATDSVLNEIPYQAENGFMIATYVLACFLTILLTVSALYFLRQQKQQKKQSSSQSAETEKYIQGENAQPKVQAEVEVVEAV